MNSIRPNILSFTNCYNKGVHGKLGLGRPTNPNMKVRNNYPCYFTTLYSSSSDDLPRMFLGGYRSGQRRTLLTRVSVWNSDKSPYEMLELERDADDEKIKTSYRRLAKFYHPDVYDGSAKLDEGETAETRFIKILAAYELLSDEKKRRSYDTDHRANPVKASEAWLEWLIKKKKAFNQRGSLAMYAWAEQQRLQMTLKARHMSRSKTDPDEEKKLLRKEKAAYKEFYDTTLKRHALVLRKRDIMRRKAEEDQKKELSHLLALEGLELDEEEEVE